MTGPLATLRVLDFTTLLPGPYATLLLADLGADVIRVEAPHRVDLVRLVPPYDGDSSAWHQLLNRNKRSLALDLRHPQAVAVVKQLVADTDIVIEGFRPGVMARLGLDDATLRAINPRLIYCALTGYGQTGPYARRAGHDINYLALSGIMSHSGRPETGPVLPGVQIADIGGGALLAVAGILAAVVQRQVTGVGQTIDCSLLDGAVAWNALAAAQTLVGGTPPGYGSERLNGGSVYDFYRTADGGYLAVGGLEPKFWEAFCAAIGRIDLYPRGLSLDPAEQAAVKAEVQAVLATRTREQWEAVFAAVDACVEPVLDSAEMLRHPQVAARGLVVDVPRPDGTAQPQIGSPLKFSAAEAAYRHVGSAPGAHSDAILGALGYAAADIAALRAAGAVG